MPHRCCFASPNKLRATQAKVTPPPQRQFRWRAIAIRIPTFHRMNAPTIRHVMRPDHHWLGHRRAAGCRDDRVVDGQFELQLVELPPPRRPRGANAPCPPPTLEAATNSRSCGASCHSWCECVPPCRARNPNVVCATQGHEPPARVWRGLASHVPRGVAAGCARGSPHMGVRLCAATNSAITWAPRRRAHRCAMPPASGEHT